MRKLFLALHLGNTPLNVKLQLLEKQDELDGVFTIQYMYTCNQVRCVLI